MDVDSDAIVDPDSRRSLIPGLRTRTCARTGAGGPRLRGACAVHVYEHTRSGSGS